MGELWDLFLPGDSPLECSLLAVALGGSWGWVGTLRAVAMPVLPCSTPNLLYMLL